MFSNVYQTGPQSGVELFTASSKDPYKYIEVIGKCQKIYERNIKGYMISLDDNIVNPSKIICPSSQYKQTLGIIQPLLVLQMNAPSEKQKPISFEIVVTDNTGQRRRLHFSSSFRTIQSKNELHSQIPLIIPRGEWCNLIFNLQNIVANVFNGEISFHTLDSFCWRHASCFRKIFTIPIANDSNINIPSLFDFPLGTNTNTHILHIPTIPGSATTTTTTTTTAYNNNNNNNMVSKASNIPINKMLNVSPLKVKGQSALVSHSKSKAIILEEKSIKNKKINTNRNTHTNTNTNNNDQIKNIIDNHDEEVLTILNSNYNHDADNLNSPNFYDYIESTNNIDETEIYNESIKINDESSFLSNNYEYNIKTDNNFETIPKHENIIEKTLAAKLFEKDNILTKSYLQQSIFTFNNMTSNINITEKEKLLARIKKVQERLSKEEKDYNQEYFKI